MAIIEIPIPAGAVVPNPAGGLPVNAEVDGISFIVEGLEGTATVRQVTSQSVLVDWVLVEPQPVRLTRVVPDGRAIGEFPASVTEYLDTFPLDTPDSFVLYVLTDAQTGSTFLPAEGAYVAPREDRPYTYAPPLPESTEPRYTTLAIVKKRLGIESTEYDAELTTAITTAEGSIDNYYGQSWPSTGDNPRWRTVPPGIQTAAADLSVAVYKATDAPIGVLGSDEFMSGEYDLNETTRRVLRRHPALVGFRHRRGVA